MAQHRHPGQRGKVSVKHTGNRGHIAASAGSPVTRGSQEQHAHSRRRIPAGPAPRAAGKQQRFTSRTSHARGMILGPSPKPVQ